MSETGATDRPLRLEYLDPGALDEHPGNWKFHGAEQLEALGDLVAEVGWAGALLYNERTGRLLDGHGRREKFRGQPVPVLVGSWDEEAERKILAGLDPVGWMATPDRKKVDALLGSVSLRSDRLNTLLKSVRGSSELLEPRPEEQQRPDERPEVLIPLDSIWPTDNCWSIPSLLPELQGAEVPHPVTAWGSQGHARPMPGTWHFYVHDHKFEPLWKKPERVLRSMPGAAVEPNFSTTPQTPIAVSLWHVYRKRWLARYWQSQGLRVFVDLNVSPELNEPHEATPGFAPNLLGVPKGWRAYASRAHHNEPDNLVAEWEIARAHADGAPVLFLCIGGGRQVKLLAREHSWVWVPESVETKLGHSEAEEAA